MDSDQYLNRLEAFLSSPLPRSLLAAHPNDVAKPSYTLPPEWEAWWDWAASTPEPWVELLSYYVAEQRLNSDIPALLSQMIDNVKALQLTRGRGLPPVPAGYRAHLHESQHAEVNASCTKVSTQGASPKKLHEVSAMTAHIVDLLRTSPALQDVQYVVDIGAGQGYLSWDLRAFGMHVLALDSSDTQAKGAERRGSHHNLSIHQGSLTYRIARVTPTALLRSVDEWITELAPLPVGSRLPSVIFVALHACGSLATDILRASIAVMGGGDSEKHSWSLRAAIVVGCCYNRMERRDFPLSSRVSDNCFPSSSSHLQLAAQVPSMWLDHRVRTEISLRKVSWRALLEAATVGIECSFTDGCPTTNNRLGKTSNSYYCDWEQFLLMSSAKLHKKPIPGMELFPDKLGKLEKQISILHTLRCLLGPCVESLIVWDRYAWLREVLKDRVCFEVDLLNIFDQKQASSRNIAITIVSN